MKPKYRVKTREVEGWKETYIEAAVFCGRKAVTGWTRGVHMATEVCRFYNLKDQTKVLMGGKHPWFPSSPIAKLRLIHGGAA